MMLDGDVRELIAGEIDVVSGAMKEAAKAQAKAQQLDEEAKGTSSWKGLGGANALI